MADLWLPGVKRLDCSANGLLLGYGDNLRSIFDWHTFETGSKGYDFTVDAGAKYLASTNKLAHFVWNPVLGGLVQLLPMNMGARTLKANDASGRVVETNRWGRVHASVETIANAARPFTLDMTRIGLEDLTLLLNFLRSHGIGDQWAWVRPDGTGQPPPAYPHGSVRRRYPDRSGHAYHSGWVVNDHGDPGEIDEPWHASAKEDSTMALPRNTGTPAGVHALETALRADPAGYNFYCTPRAARKTCIRYTHGHRKDSTHYVDINGNPAGGTHVGGAIDIGKDPASGAPISTYEKAWLDDLATDCIALGYGVIWGVAAHFDHAHIDYLARNTDVVYQGPNYPFRIPEILWVQEALAKLGLYTGTLDGLREGGTRAAIRTFQTRAGLAPDENPGPKTQTAIKAALAALAATPVDVWPKGHVADWQRGLTVLGYKGKDGRTLAADDSLGANTQWAVREFQTDNPPLQVDGRPGPASTKRLNELLAVETEPPVPPKPPVPQPPVPDKPPSGSLADRTAPFRWAGPDAWSTAVAAAEATIPSGRGIVLYARDTPDAEAALQIAMRSTSTGTVALPVRPGGGLPGSISKYIASRKPAWLRAVGGRAAVTEATLSAGLTAAGINH